MTLKANEIIPVFPNRSGQQGLSQQEFENLLQELNAYGGIRAVDAQSGTPLDLNTSATPIPFLGYNQETPVIENLTSDFTNGVVTADNAGVYAVDFQTSITPSSTGSFPVFEIYQDALGTPVATGYRCGGLRFSSGAHSNQPYSIKGVLSLTAGEAIAIYFYDSATVFVPQVFSVHESQLILTKIGINT